MILLFSACFAMCPSAIIVIHSLSRPLNLRETQARGQDLVSNSSKILGDWSWEEDYKRGERGERWDQRELSESSTLPSADRFAGIQTIITNKCWERGGQRRCEDRIMGSSGPSRDWSMAIVSPANHTLWSFRGLLSCYILSPSLFLLLFLIFSECVICLFCDCGPYRLQMLIYGWGRCHGDHAIEEWDSFGGGN